MGRSTAHLGLLMISMVTLGACGNSTPPAADSAPPAAPSLPTVFEAMVQTFMPQANKMWEMAGNLYADNGELDAKQLSDEQWQELNAAAVSVRDLATAFSQSSTFHVAPAGAKLLNEGAPGAAGAAQVQASIDANPQGFKDEAAKLAAVADEFAAAASAHDAVKADDASNRLTEVCEACHKIYWYPEQAAPQ